MVPTDLILISVGLAAALMNALLSHDYLSRLEAVPQWLTVDGQMRGMVEIGFRKRILWLGRVRAGLGERN